MQNRASRVGVLTSMGMATAGFGASVGTTRAWLRVAMAASAAMSGSFMMVCVCGLGNTCKGLCVQNMCEFL